MARHESIRKRSRSEIRQIIRRLNTRQKRDLYAILGPSLDTDRVPAGVWQEWEREIQREFASVLGILYLTTWDAFRRIVPVDWSGWPVEARQLELAEEYAAKRSDFLSKSYVENTRNPLSQSPAEDRSTEFNRVFGKDREEVVAVTETATVIPAAEAGYSGEAEKANPNLKLLATWKHHDHRPPGHSRAQINPCPTCSPLEGLRQSDWPEKFAKGPPAHPNCDCHLEWEIVLKKQDE